MSDTDVKMKTFARTPSSWDPQDDILLRKLKEQQKLGWKEIASHFTNRTPNACQFRWRRLRSGSLKNSTPAAASTTTPIQIEEAKPSVIQPKNIVRRHSLLSSSSVSGSPMIMMSTSRSGSFSDLQSTTSQTSESSRQRQRSYSTTTGSIGSGIAYHHDDPLSSTNHQNSPVPQPHLLHNLHGMRSTPRNHPHLFHTPSINSTWEEDEDDLLLTRRERELSFTELSILLPSKSETDIWLRIEYLENAKGLSGNISTQQQLRQLQGQRKNSIPALSRSLSISSSISTHSTSVQPPMLPSRDNSIVGGSFPMIQPSRSRSSSDSSDASSSTSSTRAGLSASPTSTPIQISAPSTQNSVVNEEKDFTKKRSIKLPSLGSILNNF